MKLILWYHTTDEEPTFQIGRFEVESWDQSWIRSYRYKWQLHNVIHRLIITPATTQCLSNNIYSNQVGPNSGVIRNQTGNHRDHRTVRFHVQKPGREPVSGKYWKGIPAHISPIPSTLPIHQQARLHLRAQVTLQCATPIQIPTRSRFLRDTIDHFVAIHTNMSRNPHQPKHKLIRSQPPQSFLTLVDDRMSLWWNLLRTQRLNRTQTVSQNQEFTRLTRSHEAQGGEQCNNLRSENTRWFLEAISKKWIPKPVPSSDLEPSVKIRVEPLNLSDMIEEKQLEETTECNAWGKSANARIAYPRKHQKRPKIV
jgi:hypothetical protein